MTYTTNCNEEYGFSVHPDGRFYGLTDKGECILFPSKDQRDWSNFVVPKKPKVDLPKDTLVYFKDIQGRWLIGYYYERGIATSHLCGYLVKYSIIIPMSLYPDKPDESFLDNVAATDENNYGMSYWNKFKEE